MTYYRIDSFSFQIFSDAIKPVELLVEFFNSKVIFRYKYRFNHR